MKNSLVNRLLASVVLPALIVAAVFTGCSSSSSGGGESDTGGAVTNVAVTPSGKELEAGSSVELTAEASSTGSLGITYSWKITEGAGYASLSAASGKTVTLTVKNSDTEEHTVKVSVTASNGATSKTADAYFTVKAAQTENTTPELVSVSVSGTQKIASNGSGDLSAEAKGENLENAEITYVWEITAGGDYAEVSGNGASAAITGKDANADEQTVKVKVTAKLGETSVVSEEYSVTIAAKGAEVKDEITGLSASASAGEVEPGKTVTLTAEPETNGNPKITYAWEISDGKDYADLSAASGESVTLTAKNSDSQSHAVKVTVTAKDSGGNEKTADVSVTVKAGTTQEETKTGDVSISVTVADETKYITVIFKDAVEEGYTSKESVTVRIKSGDTVKSPDGWEREGYVLTWLDESNNVAKLPATLSLGEEETAKTVTYTASWSSSHTVTFKDEDGGTNTSVELDVADGAAIDASDIPAWTKEHYTLSWSSSVSGVSTASAITQDVTFTAVWTEDAKFTVTFKDSSAYEGDTAKDDDVQTVYTGEKATAPSWTKENYTLSWTSSVEGLATDSAITSDVTFTAVWTENAKHTVTFKDSAVDGFDTQTDVTQTVYEGKTATVPSWTKGSYNLTWDSSVSGLTPASKITADVTFTAVWSAKVTVVAGTYNLSTKKDNGTVIFTSQNAGATQTDKTSGITVTCKIDSKGANLNTKGGELTFTIASDMTLTFTDSASKGVVISTTDGYVGTSGTTKSGTLTSATALKLGAGSYTIVGATSSSAKIATLTFAVASN